VARPPLSGPGDLLVKIPGYNHGAVSNAFPIALVGPGPEPLSVTGVQPATTERLLPGTDQTMTLLGTAFQAGPTQVRIDGVPLATAFTVVGPTTITFDLPDLSLGAHTVEVVKGAESDSTALQVVANADPTLQCGSGDDGNAVPSGGFPILYGGLPSDLLLLIGSPSSLPSDLPGKIHLDLGAGFTQSVNLGAVVIGPGGIASETLAVGGIAGIDLWFQALRVPTPFAFPLQESNLQRVFVQP
jgi:hypothetical protein